MTKQQEAHILSLFSEKMETLHGRVWHVEEIAPEKWTVRSPLGVVTLSFDWRYPFVFFDMADFRARGKHLFVDTYTVFLQLLEEAAYDGLVKSNYWLYHEKLYRDRRLPFHAVGKTATERYHWMREIAETVPYASFSYYEGMLLLTSDYVPAHAWIIDFQETQHFAAIGERIRALRDKEYQVIQSFTEKYPNIYHDPAFGKVVIFNIPVPFGTACLVDEKGEFRAYRATFGKETIECDTLSDLEGFLKERMHDHIISDRLRAVAKGRTKKNR